MTLKCGELLHSNGWEKMVEKEKRLGTLCRPPWPIQWLESSKAFPFSSEKMESGLALPCAASRAILHFLVVSKCSRGLGGGKIANVGPGDKDPRRVPTGGWCYASWGLCSELRIKNAQQLKPQVPFLHKYSTMFRRRHSKSSSFTDISRALMREGHCNRHGDQSK